MLITFIYLFISASVSEAAIEILSVSGASKYDPDKMTIYAGTSGEQCTGVTSTCNSCTGYGASVTTANGGTLSISPEACNQSRINDSGGMLSIRFTGPTFGTPIITDSNKSTNIAIGPESNTDTHFISVSWDVLCGSITGNPDCDSQDAEDTIYLGVDKNADMIFDGNEESLAINIKILSKMEDFVNMQVGANGIESFEVQPGDERFTC